MLGKRQVCRQSCERCTPDVRKQRFVFPEVVLIRLPVSGFAGLSLPNYAPKVSEAPNAKAYAKRPAALWSVAPSNKQFLMRGETSFSSGVASSNHRTAELASEPRR